MSFKAEILAIRAEGETIRDIRILHAERDHQSTRLIGNKL